MGGDHVHPPLFPSKVMGEVFLGLLIGMEGVA
jgi:hypothetical protein